MISLVNLILFLAIILMFFLIVFLLRGKKEDNISFLREDLKEIRTELRESREKNIESLQNQWQESRRITEEGTKIIRDLTEKITRFDETNKQVIGFAEQLQSLEDILKNPKQRGILGEYYLEELLKNVFSPNQYQMQYSFEDGQIVDAVIFCRDNKIIPIDSKFSLENYNKIIEEKDVIRREQLEKIFKQDLKNRIEETAKYIRPEEGTLDFAFMFIPAEAIYYDLLVNKIGAIKSNTRDLIEYAVREKHVHVVSPTSFYAYLQTILQGLRAFQIEKSAMEIRKGVEALGKHIASYNEYMKKLGNNLSTVCNAYNAAYKELGKIDKDVVKITQGERKVEPAEIEKPNLD
jgi:DNA recombination protein RmuC